MQTIRSRARSGFIITIGLAVVALLMFGTAPPAHAGADWSELDDAGELPATAQLTLGSGALTSIGG